MESKCNVIKDILPLYAEDMVSTDTKMFVEEHLEHCTECRAEFEWIRKPVAFVPDTDVTPLKNLKKKLLVKRIQTIFFTATLVFAVLVSVFAILTSPKFFPYSDSLMNVIENPDKTVTITFDNKVTGYSCTKRFDSETGAEVYCINAWNTFLDLRFSNRGKQNIVISPVNTDVQVYYAQNDGSEDVLIYGSYKNTNEGTVTLPRLILMLYFLLALFVFVVLIALRFLLRKKETVTIWIDRVILFPLAYIMAHFCTKGISFETYSSQRDFCIIIFVAILLYCTMLTGFSLYKAKKERKEK